MMKTEETEAEAMRKSAVQSLLPLQQLPIFFDDPDATNIEVEEPWRKRHKKDIIVSPLYYETQAKASNKKRKVGTRAVAPSSCPAPSATPSSRPIKYKGVRIRRWGKWASEIRNPFTGKCEWLGTFETAEAAKAVYNAAVSRFAAEKARRKGAIAGCTVKPRTAKADVSKKQKKSEEVALKTEVEVTPEPDAASKAGTPLPPPSLPETEVLCGGDGDGDGNSIGIDMSPFDFDDICHVFDNMDFD